MKYPVLDERLAAVASFVRNGSVLADIGTDHGYLAANLVGSGVCPSAFACDIGSQPLARAKETIKRYALTGRIITLLSDGLSALTPNCAQDIVIAGMGGELIAQIISGTPWLENPAVRLILQPMTRAEHLRAFLFRSGYEIMEERGVCAGIHCYTVLCVHFTGRRQMNPDELAICFGGLLASKEQGSREYVRRYLATLERKADGLKRSGSKNQGSKADGVNALIKRARAVGLASKYGEEFEYSAT